MSHDDEPRRPTGRPDFDLAHALQRLTVGAPEERLVLLGSGASAEAGYPIGPTLHAGFIADENLPCYRTISTRLSRTDDIERVFRLLDFVADYARSGQQTLASDAAAIWTVASVHANPELQNNQARREIRYIHGQLRRQLWRPWTLPVPDEDPRTKANYYLRQLADASLGGTIVTLNYDDSLEKANSGRVITSGTDGGNLVTVPPLTPDRVRVLKLHGSLDWQRFEDDVFRTAHPLGAAEYEPAIIFGLGNKLRHYGPYLDLMHEFRVSLNVARCVVWIGYGFRDRHINELIRIWAKRPPEGDLRKQIVVCCGPDATKLEPWLYALQHHPHMEPPRLVQLTARSFIEGFFA
jgi:hypothetical protein